MDVIRLDYHIILWSEFLSQFFRQLAHVWHIICAQVKCRELVVFAVGAVCAVDPTRDGENAVKPFRHSADRCADPHQRGLDSGFHV